MTGPEIRDSAAVVRILGPWLRVRLSAKVSFCADDVAAVAVAVALAAVARQA